MNSLPSWPWHVGFLSLREHYTDATLYVVFLKFDLYLGRYMGFHARDCMWIWKYRENRHFNRHFLETATHSTTPLFSCTDHNQQTTVTLFGENRRLHPESFKQNYYIISLWVIIQAIFTWQQVVGKDMTAATLTVSFCDGNVYVHVTCSDLWHGSFICVTGLFQV